MQTKKYSRVEEEFNIVHRLGIKNQPFSLRSAMMNVDNLLLEEEKKTVCEILENIKTLCAVNPYHNRPCIDHEEKMKDFLCPTCKTIKKIKEKYRLT